MPSKEKRCFEWYVLRSANKLPGAFFSDYWTKLLLQCCATEPVIRYAVCAVSSAHQEEVKGRQYAEHGLTLRQYTKAIHGLQQQFHHTGLNSTRVTLITCLLLIQSDFLRGHYQSGLMHLEYGLKVLQGINDVQECPMDGWFVTYFTRLFVQARFLGQLQHVRCESLIDNSLSERVTIFRSIHHARRNLEQIILRCFDLNEKNYHPTVSASELINIRENLCTWLVALGQTLLQKQNSRDSIAFKLLLQFHRMAIVLAQTCLQTSEIQYDQCRMVFSEMISFSVEMYQGHFSDENRRAHQDPERTSPNSVSDIGWIAPLYYTAIKCRNYAMRQQALALLELLPHKEGIWNSQLAVALGKKIVQVEEKNFSVGRSSKFDVLASPTDEDLILPILPEEVRISRMDILLPKDKDDKLCVKYQRNSEDTWAMAEFDQNSERWTDIETRVQAEKFCPVNSSLSFHNFSAASLSTAQPGAGAI